MNEKLLYWLFEVITTGLDHLRMVNDNIIISVNNRGQEYLILVELSSEPLYILGCLVDLGCQTRWVPHLRIFLINILHLPQGFTEERREREKREIEEERGKVTFRNWFPAELRSE